MIRLALAALLVLVVTGCARGCARKVIPSVPPVPPAVPVPPPAPPPMPGDPPADPAVALRAERDDLRASLAGVESRLKAAEAERVLAPLRALTTWAAWVGGVVALLAVVALVLLRVGLALPIGGRLIAGIGLAGLTLSACAVGLGQSLPWVGPIGIGMLVLLVIGGIAWAALTWRRGGQAAAREWQEYAAALPDDLRAHLDAYSKVRQGRAAAIVDSLLRHP